MPSLTETAHTALIELLGPERLLTDPGSLRHYGRDWTRFTAPAPAAIALPSSVDEVQAIVAKVKAARGGPVYHQVERRADTHIFLSVLAYHLLVAIEKTLLDQDVHTSWQTVRQALKTHQVCTVVLPADSGAVVRIRQGSTPEPQPKQIYRLLDMPKQIMAPIMTWTEPATTP